MKIRVTNDFYDKEADLALRRAGAVLDVSEKRAEQLIRLGLAVPAAVKRPKKAAE